MPHYRLEYMLTQEMEDWLGENISPLIQAGAMGQATHKADGWSVGWGLPGSKFLQYGIVIEDEEKFTLFMLRWG